VETRPLAKETIRLFTYLYSVVVALSLTTAVRTLISTSEGIRSPFGIPILDLVMFTTFLVITVPFYHGALMFLVRTYRKGFATKKRGELLVDFAVLLSEAIVMLAMAEALLSSIDFIGWLLVLMVLDVSWVIFLNIKSRKRKCDAPLSWVWLDTPMIVISVILIQYAATYMEFFPGILLLASSIRSFLDYKMNYELYFPSEEAV
jgi:hypothetical protein